MLNSLISPDTLTPGGGGADFGEFLETETQILNFWIDFFSKKNSRFSFLKNGKQNHSINDPNVILQNAIVIDGTSLSRFTKIAEELTLNKVYKENIIRNIIATDPFNRFII